MGFLRSMGPLEIILIFGIVMLFAGATRLPKLAGSMGKAIKEFRKSADGAMDEPVKKTTTRRSRAKTPKS